MSPIMPPIYVEGLYDRCARCGTPISKVGCFPGMYDFYCWNCKLEILEEKKGRKKMNKYLYWGALPGEQDGGAVVNYYLIKKQNQLRPLDEYYGYPKVPEELDSSALPFVNYFDTRGSPTSLIPEYMLSYEIPLLNIFHIGKDDINNIIDPVHNVGGKIILHQTIHWEDDDILNSHRLSEIDKIVAPTEYAKSVFTRIGRLPRENIEVIPHAVEVEKYIKRTILIERQLGIDKRTQKVILYSGRLGFLKGVQEIIPIIHPLVREYNCVFIIRGSVFHGVDEAERLGYIFSRLATNNPNVIFLPEWQPAEVMEELFALSDVLIFNSAHEGFGVPLIEIGAASGVPVTTALANHREILGNTGDIAMLLDPTVPVGHVNNNRELRVASASQLYTSVKWLLDNPDEMEAMGIRGLQNVYNRFNLDIIAKNWLKLYDELIAGKSMELNMQERMKFE